MRLVAGVDHLVYATPDLNDGIAAVETMLGVRAAAGGKHPGRGTHNALISLSDSSYLEIVAPDPTQLHSGVPRWFGIDQLTGPRLVTWASKADRPSHVARAAARQGLRLGQIMEGRRKTPQGVTLQWEFTDPATVLGDGLVPFFISWRDCPHPAVSAPRGPMLIELHGEHPEPRLIERQLAAVGVEMRVGRGQHPALIATLQVGGRAMELR